MATQFSELQKLLINVANNKCDAFIKAHVNNTWPLEESDENPRPSELPKFTAGENDTYYNKVVFLQKYNAIYTKGAFFGYNGDLKASFNDLVEDLKTGVTEKGITVKYDADQNKIVTTVDAATYNTDTKKWGDNIDNVVTGSTVKTYVDEKVAGAVAEATAAMNFKGNINSATEFAKQQGLADNGDVYVVNADFTANGETFEIGDLIIFRKDGARTTYVVVEKNLDGAVEKHSTWTGVLESDKVVVAIGSNKVKPTNYTLGGASLSATESGEYILATEAAVDAAVRDAIDAIDEAKSTHTGTYVTYAYSTTNGITHVDSIAPILAEYKVSTNALGETTIDNIGVDGLVDNNALNTVIGYLDGKINAVDCEVTTLTEVSDSDYFSVTEDSTDKTDNDRNYKIELNVVNLGDAVGMTYDEATGKWSAPESNPSAKNGLASAADVANELVSDEKVIAAALNDHEARIDTLEGFAGDINQTIQDQLVRGEVTINGLTATATKEGLVDATILANVINALDPWEEYV
jgi:hypothetical protein